MPWEDWSAFLEIAGYGIYVWGAYLLALVVVASEIIVLVVSRRSILDHLGLSRRKRHERASVSAASKSE